MNAKLSVIAAAILLTVCISFYVVSGKKEDSPTSTMPDGSVDRTLLQADVDDSNPEETDFKIDPDRLYDLAYETDPALARFAKSLGKTPECIIEMAKTQIDGKELDRSRCKEEQDNEFKKYVVRPGVFETRCDSLDGVEYCQSVEVGNHPYEAYSDDELRSLAQTSPEAAVILARRLPDVSESEAYYERAVALSGRPGPLVEWMTQRDQGGLIYINGKLDLEKAITGYEIYLTTERLGLGGDGRAGYERVLSEENVDLEPIQESASRRFERLSKTRQNLVGRSWGS